MRSGRRCARDDHADSGHTLVELMVVISLFTILTIAVGTLTVLGHQVSSGLRDRLDNTTQGQVAIDATSKVLRTAVLPDQIAEAACSNCEDTALIEANRSQVAFYASLGDPVGPTLVTMRVMDDPFAPANETSGQLVQTMQPPTSLGNGRYSFCDATEPGCIVQTRVLARGLADEDTEIFAYYDFSGTLITRADLGETELAKVSSVEITLTVQNVQDIPGQDTYPSATVVKRVRLPNSDINILVKPSTAI